jgi:D-cysteine desulfhydrase
LGIDVGKLWAGFPASVAHLTSQLCRRLGQPHTFLASEVPLLEATYVGLRYGLPSTEGLAAMQQLARLEGIVLDPIYTGKAFAGLLDLARQGQLGRTEPLIFLHTGGLPALFARSNAATK